MLQAHPYVFARHLSTLDHLTRGRVSWNVVTSFLDSAARALGYDRLPPSEERYAHADEYLQVVYKLLEGSWEDDAVVRDRERGAYVEPGKVHDVDECAAAFVRALGRRSRRVYVPGPMRTAAWARTLITSAVADRIVLRALAHAPDADGQVAALGRSMSARVAALLTER